MATVKAYSVSKSSGGSSASTVYSYQPSASLQDGSTLAFDAATPEDAMRTGLSQAYSHGGVACADSDAVNQFQNEGLTPTLINPSGAASGVPSGNQTLTTAGGGNPNYPSSTVTCSTTNLDAGDTGAGLIVRFTTNSSGVPAGNVTIVSAGRGYANGDSVGIDGFPGSDVTIAGVS